MFFMRMADTHHIRLVGWLTSGREKSNIYHFKLTSSNPIVIVQQNHYVYSQMHDKNLGLM